MSYERVYMVEQMAHHESRLLTAHATLALAEAAVEEIIAKMPNRREWHKDLDIKRMSANHGKAVIMWTSRTYGQSSNHISNLAVVVFEVNQGEVISRLADVKL